MYDSSLFIVFGVIPVAIRIDLYATTFLDSSFFAIGSPSAIQSLSSFAFRLIPSFR